MLWDLCVSFRGVIEDDGKAIKAWTESSGEGRYLSIYINEFTHIYFIYIYGYSFFASIFLAVYFCSWWLKQPLYFAILN